MRIGIQAWGSRGDIMPMLALGKGLLRDGHNVSVAITSIDNTDYSETVQRHALKVRYVCTPVIESESELAHIQDAIIAQPNPLKQARMILETLFEPAADPMFWEAKRLCQENDLVIGHFFHYPLRIAAEMEERPYASIMLAHNAIPSRFIPPSGLPALGRTMNRVWWWLRRTFLNKKLKPVVDHLRTAQDLAPATDLIDDVWTSPHLNLIAVSQMLCSRQNDWGTQHRVCGEFVLPSASKNEYLLDPDLTAFIHAGSPPVYVSFGSVMPTGASARKETIDILVQAAQRSSCRMIIQALPWRDCETAPTDSVHFVGATPHDKVFPLCAAVVHHGGAGTVHTTLRAGIPSVVVAHIDEQHFWGRELKRIGVAPNVLMKRNWNAKTLAKRITQALNDTHMREQARRAASSMRTENGISKAAAEISMYFDA